MPILESVEGIGNQFEDQQRKDQENKRSEENQLEEIRADVERHEQQPADPTILKEIAEKRRELESLDDIVASLKSSLDGKKNSHDESFQSSPDLTKMDISSQVSNFSLPGTEYSEQSNLPSSVTPNDVYSPVSKRTRLTLSQANKDLDQSM